MRNERCPARLFFTYRVYGFMVTPQLLIAPKYGLRVTEGGFLCHSARYRGVCTPGQEASVCGVSRSVTSDSLQPRELQPSRLLCPWILQAIILEWVAMPSSR